MAYPTICVECRAGDHAHCGKSELKPALAKLQEWNAAHPDDMVIGGGFCVCRHGAAEGAFERSVRDQLRAT